MSTSPAATSLAEPEEEENADDVSSEGEEHEADGPGNRPELGHLAQWTVSSHKYGFGVDNLRDGNENTFWQSEGPQPHVIDLSFPKRVMVTTIAILTSHPRDDSYTPSKVSIRAGTGLHDLQEVRLDEFNKPDGWVFISLRPVEAGRDGDDANAEAVMVDGPPIPCHHLRILIVANHLNGKDTHVRGLKVFGLTGTDAPLVAEDTTDRADARATEGRRLLELGHDGSSGFKTDAFRMHECIR